MVHYMKLVQSFYLCSIFTRLKLLAKSFATAIDIYLTDTLHLDVIQSNLDMQQEFYKRFYSWEKQAETWWNFLRGVTNVQVRYGRMMVLIKQSKK